MKIASKAAIAGALSFSLATSSLNVAPASAHDNGAGLAFGLATGLIIGGVLLNGHRRHHQHPDFIYGDAGYAPPQPVCYPGPLQYTWQQVCQPDYNGQLRCQNVKNYYRQQICN